MGEDTNREGLKDTPRRAAEALQFLTSGYCKTTEEVVGSGVFAEGVKGNMVVVRDIDVHSLCEHHLLPFSGKVMCSLCLVIFNEHLFIILYNIMLYCMI